MNSVKNDLMSILLSIATILILKPITGVVLFPGFLGAASMLFWMAAFKLKPDLFETVVKILLKPISALIAVISAMIECVHNYFNPEEKDLDIEEHLIDRDKNKNK